MKTLQRTGAIVALVTASLGISSETVVQAAVPASIIQMQSSLQQDSQTISIYTRQLATLNAQVAVKAHLYSIAKLGAQKVSLRVNLKNARDAATNLQQILTLAVAKLGTDFQAMTKTANQVNFKLPSSYLLSLSRI
ncbi:MAG: hypothetical protein WCO08_02130 [Actinomycetes bacterium]